MDIKELSKTYTSKKKVKTLALNNISLEFASKGLVILSGKSGSGKSTLINIISGLDTNYEGNIIYKNQNLKELSKKELNAYRNSEIGYIFQDFCLLENKTIYENLALSLEIHGSQDDELIYSILKQFDLSDHIHKYPNELSGGEQQRVSIARAILKNPNILIADEPTSSLDEENAKIVLNLLKEISKTKLVLVVTHNLALTKSYADRIIVLEKGSVLSDTKETSIEDTNEQDYVPSSKLKHLSFKFMLISILKNIKSKFAYFLFSLITLVLSLSLVGASMTLGSFNENKVLIQSLQNNKEEFLTLKSEDRDIDGFKNELTDLVKEKFPNQIIEIKSNNTSYESYFSMSARFNIPNITDDNFLLASGYYSGFVELTKQNKSLLNYNLLYGSFPKENNEIMITEYMFRAYQTFGYSFEETTKEIYSFEDLASIPFYIDNNVYKIVGILDTKFNYDYYYKLKNKGGSSTIYEEISVLNDGIHTAIFVPENFFDAYSLSSVSYIMNQNISVSNQSIQIKNDLKDNEVICPTNDLGLCNIRFENNFSKDINIIKSCSENTIYVSETFYHELEKELNINFSTIILLHLSKDMNKNLNNMQMLEDCSLRIENQYTIMLASISDTYTFIASLLKYISIFLLAFSIILTLKFSFDSIYNKKKEIAIYKALGVGYRDISIMFYLQSIFIGLITTFIAIPLTVLFTYVVNYIIYETFSSGLSLPLLSISTLVFLIVFPITFLTLTQVYLLNKFNNKLNPIQVLRSNN